MAPTKAGTKVVVVTGSNQGIGYQTVRSLCQSFQGDVILCARDETRGKEAVSKLEQEGLKPIYHQLDVEDEGSIIRLKDHLVSTYGHLHGLVNNAGAFDMNNGHILAQKQKMMNVNFYGLVKMCDHLCPLLASHARVLNVTSLMGMVNTCSSPELVNKLKSDALTREDIFTFASDYLKYAEEGSAAQHGWCKKANYEGYAASKVLVSAFTFYQQREEKKNPPSGRVDVVYNCIHPGMVVTTLTGGLGTSLPEDAGPILASKVTIPPVDQGYAEPNGQFLWSDGQVKAWDEPNPLGYINVPSIVWFSTKTKVKSWFGY